VEAALREEQRAAAAASAQLQEQVAELTERLREKEGRAAQPCDQNHGQSARVLQLGDALDEKGTGQLILS